MKEEYCQHSFKGMFVQKNRTHSHSNILRQKHKTNSLGTFTLFQKLMSVFPFQSVMASKHFNCVHITLDNLVAESDSKAAKKV